MRLLGKLPNGKVARTHSNFDIQIHKDWSAAQRSRTAKQLACSLVVAPVSFVVIGVLLDDRGVQLLAPIFLSVGAYIAARRLFDLTSNYHKCGEKLKLFDVYVVDADRVILRSQKSVLGLKPCKIAEVLECEECDAFCYIRTHDGI